MGNFINFFVRFAYLGIILAFAGLFLYAKYRKYSEETGKPARRPKIIGVVLFALGLLWVIVPFFIRMGTGNL